MGSKKHLTKEKKLDVLKDIKNGVSNKDILSKHSISMSSLMRIKRLTEEDIIKKESTRKKEAKERIVKVKTTITEEKDFIITNEKEKIVVGLIDERHEMPVSEYIFRNTINNTFNYPMFDKVVANFIQTRIGVILTPNGEYESQRDLVVYITGLSAATAAVIKQCARFNTNLTLMHYNYAFNSYEHQVIFDQFKKRTIYSIFYYADRIEMFGCSLKDFVKQNFYVLKFCELDPSSSEKNKTLKTNLAIFVDIKKAKELFASLLINTNKYFSMYLEEGNINRFGRYERRKLVLGGYNSADATNN